jgi:alkylated DNA repair dioxygenase AlkB
MNDLFNTDTGEQLPLIDADIHLWRHINIDDQQLFQLLEKETPWAEEDVVIFGKAYKQPRLIAWYGEHAYSYSGSQLQPKPWTETLLMIKKMVEERTGKTFNSVLVNYYRNNRDGMGFHSDDEEELGSQPVIASLSLGVARRFVFKHRFRKDVADVQIPLESGSLLLMQGDTQTNWKHGVPKETKPCGPRINLTFRNIFPK